MSSFTPRSDASVLLNSAQAVGMFANIARDNDGLTDLRPTMTEYVRKTMIDDTPAARTKAEALTWCIGLRVGLAFVQGFSVRDFTEAEEGRIHSHLTLKGARGVLDSARRWVLREKYYLAWDEIDTFLTSGLSWKRTAKVAK